MQVLWTRPGGSTDEWSVPVSGGLFLVPIDADVPVDGDLTFRFLDESGTVIWVVYED